MLSLAMQAIQPVGIKQVQNVNSHALYYMIKIYLIFHISLSLYI